MQGQEKGITLFIVVKKILISLLITFLFVLFTLLALREKGKKYDHECKAFVETSIPRIFDQWNRAELLTIATAEFMASTTEKAFNENSSRFGSLRSFRNVSGTANVKFHTNSLSFSSTCHYSADLQFEKGTATLFIAMVRHHDKWKIVRLSLRKEP